jgi:hypothetical protein
MLGMRWVSLFLTVFGTTVVLLFALWKHGLPLRWSTSHDLKELARLSQQERSQRLLECERRSRQKLRFFFPTVLAFFSVSLGATIAMSLECFISLPFPMKVLVAIGVAVPGMYLARLLEIRQKSEILRNDRHDEMH